MVHIRHFLFISYYSVDTILDFLLSFENQIK